MPDRIAQWTLVKAPIDRVWRAISDHKEFGEWFRVSLDQPFEVGREVTGHITHPGYEHVQWRAKVEAIEPPHLLAFRWHPYAVDPELNYSNEPTTLVEFKLSERDGGTLVEVVESGFDALPLHRRDIAFRMNTQGWSQQMHNIREYVA